MNLVASAIEVTRSGAPVAVIGPVKARFISAERFSELLDGAPEPDQRFADDLREIRAGVGVPGEPWPC